MDTWLIVVIVIAVLIVLALVALAITKRGGASKERKREQALEHLREAEVLAARADEEQALADEQAARAQRERAEVEERTALAEKEAHEHTVHAQQERSRAAELKAKAEKLAPGLAQSEGGHARLEDGDRREVVEDHEAGRQDDAARPEGPHGATRA
ncbi:hypothetical protein O2W15_02220 [Modestobacter sp. VKM Ac-2979]|uniref:hypothetical protein n=1 Tax=unclassified Modestobacter TaxID=2643866 RepID=UPI0022AB9195|nr:MULTISPECIES: hypothetical protein [unclassified Modestobacter]MCZ2810242.1 hypothetical protein [Modestobacter sp. VKM Ac-2979]MCZ2841728.1 hypothetical protein [Modestobacter sp. VKM Ac-2980]